jgi:hypothetical protein
MKSGLGLDRKSAWLEVRRQRVATVAMRRRAGVGINDDGRGNDNCHRGTEHLPVVLCASVTTVSMQPLVFAARPAVG